MKCSDCFSMQNRKKKFLVIPHRLMYNLIVGFTRNETNKEGINYEKKSSSFRRWYRGVHFVERLKRVSYRFKTTSDLDGHTVGNLLLTASSEITGNLSDGIEALSKVFNLKGKVVPLTEENVVLMGEMEDGSIIEGEHHITRNHQGIKRVYYKEKPKPTKEAVKALEEADLIILSMGSLFTSIIPNLICDEILEAIDRSKGKIMYACNMVTQPGETEGFKVSDHVRLLNQYLGRRKIDVVIANDGQINEDMAKRYESLEQKDPVELDRETTEGLVERVLSDDYVMVRNNLLRHNVMKLSMHIFGYLLEQE